MKGKILRISAQLLIVLLVGYFYGHQFKKNWMVLGTVDFSVDKSFLCASLFLTIMSALLETHIWQVCINRHLLERKLSFAEGVALVNASGLLKYLPGRVWIYTAQLVWLKKYGITASKILHANMICILGSMTVSLYLGFAYLATCTDLLARTGIYLGIGILVSLNLAYFVWNTVLLNKLIALVNKYARREIQAVTNSIPLLVYTQVVYACSWLIAGGAGYFLVRGIGVQIQLRELSAVLASMSMSWLAGYLAFITPGGLGVREGMMLFMLNGVVAAQTALLFPILSRILLMIAEGILGCLAVVIGTKHDLFSRKHVS